MSVTTSTSSVDVTVPLKSGYLSLGTEEGLDTTGTDSNENCLGTLNVSLSADEYAHQGNYTLTITIKHAAISSTANINDADWTTGTTTIPMKITSNLSSSYEYNKFLGVIPNEFDGTLGETWVTGIVTFVGWLIIGWLVMLVAVPVTAMIVTKKDTDERKVLKNTLYKMCHAIIFLNAVGRTLRCMGANEETIAITNELFYIIVILVGILVAWQLYKLVIHHIVTRADKAADEVGSKDIDVESLEPLLMYIGEIVLACVGVFAIMGLFGVDVGAIITSAGIVSLGISYGAKETLAQFFAGLVILATRPFKKGDLIQLGNDSNIYLIRKVNIMFTEMGNWDNTDVNQIPNNVITSSKIRNITKETLVYKYYLSMDVSYNADLSKAREIMQRAASMNPHVITDGTVKRPYTRVEAFQDSNITIKMGFYVDDFNSYPTVAGQIRQTIYDLFKKEGVDIDYQTVTLKAAGPELASDAKKEANADSARGRPGSLRLLPSVLGIRKPFPIFRPFSSG